MLKIPILQWTEARNAYDVRMHIQRVFGSFCRKDDILFNAAMNGGGDGFILEVGAGTGYSTVALAAGSKLANRERVISMDVDIGYGPDPFIEAHRRSNGILRWMLFCENLIACGVHDWVDIVVANSQNAHEWFSVPLRLVFLDGTHDEEFVQVEILKYGGMLSKGGEIYVHDYHFDGDDDYSNVVREILSEKGSFCDFREWDSEGVEPSMLASARKV